MEKDGSIAYEYEGDNVIFNRQAEISLYLVPEKFIPGQLHGKTGSVPFSVPHYDEI